MYGQAKVVSAGIVVLPRVINFDSSVYFLFLELIIMERFSRNALTRAVIGAVAVSTLTLAAVPATAQTLDTGYQIAYNLVGGAKDSEVYQTGWDDINLLKATVSGSSVVLQPNFSLYEENPGDAFWRDNGGAGPGGNKWMELSLFGAELVTASGAESMQTFTGCTTSNTLASPYGAIAFIKVFSADYSALYGEVTAPVSGSFDLSIPLAGDVDVNVQKGFTTSGPNANPADEEALGSASVSLGATCPSGGGGSGASDPTAVPVLPIWGMVLLTGIMGLFGARAAGRKRK